MFFPGGLCESVPQHLPPALEVNSALLPVPLLGDLPLHTHVEAVPVGGEGGQLLRHLQTCHHWHWSLLCLQSAEWLEGVQLQPTSQRDTGGRAKVEQPLNFKAFVIQVKTGAPSGVGIKNVTPRLDRGLKVIVDRNFDRCTRISLSNESYSIIQGVCWNCLYWQRRVPPLIGPAKRVPSFTGFGFSSFIQARSVSFTHCKEQVYCFLYFFSGPAHTARPWQRTHRGSWWHPHQHGV